MQRYKVDLHNHSPIITSDYRGHTDTSAADIVRAAHLAGLDVLGISDHFAVEYFRAVYDAAEALSVTGSPKLMVVAGCELKITWSGEEVHLITLLPPDSAEAGFEELMGFLDFPKAERIIELLPKVLIEFDPVRVVDKVASLGGMAFIAHIDRFFGEYCLMDRPIVEYLVQDSPLSAIEVVDKKNSEVLRARTNGVRHIQSSDSHSVNEVGRRYSELAMEDLSFEGLKQALLMKAFS
jgi:PHP family Zn ribbon phosphoesterase